MTRSLPNAEATDCEGYYRVLRIANPGYKKAPYCLPVIQAIVYMSMSVTYQHPGLICTGLFNMAVLAPLPQRVMTSRRSLTSRRASASLSMTTISCFSRTAAKLSQSPIPRSDNDDLQAQSPPDSH